VKRAFELPTRGVVLESIAVGTPVVAHDLPGVLEIAAHSPLVYPVDPKKSDQMIDRGDRTFKLASGRASGYGRYGVMLNR